ncbi:MAG: GH3 auxin-responsive promoter family protein [Candidatus Wallbacteria bacterium]|nr:GH3 auxin-responsive promoter family protein [Candidatus Wallbacteria bacterium]
MRWTRTKNSIFSLFTEKKNGSTAKFQKKALLARLNDSAETVLGKKYGFREISSTQSYQQKVPVHHYEDLKPYWDSESTGNINVTVGSRIHKFAVSTGTTGIPKLIPVTRKLLRDFRRRGMQLVSIYLKAHPESRILSKKHLAITGSAILGKTQSGIPYGTISGIMAEGSPLLMRHKRIPTSEVINLCDWNQKADSIAEQARHQDIGLILGIPATILNYLEKIKGIYSKSDFEFFASNLEAIFCSGVNYRSYQDKIQSLLGRKVNFLDYYAASEGIFGHQSAIDPDSMEFFSDTIFFEFIPFHEYLQKDYSNRKLLHQLKDGEDYALLVTTGNGTFSYVLGDLIQCVDHRVPLFRVKGRTVLTLNLAGEKTAISVVEKTVQSLSRELNSEPGEFFVTGRTINGRQSYLWVIEKNSIWDSQGTERLASRLDHFLQEHNNLYKLLYPTNFSPSQVLLIERDSFKAWFERKNADLGHSKIPRIIKDPRIAEDIIGKMEA